MNSPKNPGEVRLGDLLVRHQLVTPLQLRDALEAQRSTGKRLSDQLIAIGAIEETALTRFLAAAYHVPAVDLSDIELDADTIALVPRELVLRHHVVPISVSGNVLLLAMADPSDIYAVHDVEFATGFKIEVVVASETGITTAIERYYSATRQDSEGLEDVVADLDDSHPEFEVAKDEEEPDADVLSRSATEAPVVRLVNLLIHDALERGASDIHIEPYEQHLRIRFRIDGVLYDITQPPAKLRYPIVSRIKIMAALNIAERRLPQDGRIKLKLGRNREIDIRVSICPTILGEKVVLRLLDKSNLQLDMTRLGFEESALAAFRGQIHRPYGMILITGPTGSGKTTTLYSTLMELNRSDCNVSTVEDPVEYRLYGISQVQVHDGIGLSFAATLRSLLRQDPDIIMVGEIRDYETAEIGIKAALTGHLVLSTMHTNDAPSSVVRLLQMGMEPFLVASSINLVGAQRLVRRICVDCKDEETVPSDVLLAAGVPPEEVTDFRTFRGKGCRICNHTGYKGRIAVYEILVLTEELRDLVLRGASALELKREAIRHGMRTLRMSALTKVGEGLTSLEETVRSTAPD